MDKELKPCPFCGNDHEDGFIMSSDDGTDNGLKAVLCLKCLAFGPQAANDDTAVEFWNERSEK